MSEKTLGVSYNNNEKNPIVIRKRGRRKNVTMRLNVFRLNALSGGWWWGLINEEKSDD